MKRIFVDPPYVAYDNNKLFDVTDPILNRDDSLAPYVKLKSDFAKLSIELLTYDQINKFTKKEIAGDGYISFGILRDKNEWEKSGLRLIAFYIMEPPLVIPELYDSLPFLTNHFEKVFVHNTDGDCYSLKNVNHAKLKKLYWPQPYGQVVSKYWENKNRKQAVLIVNGNHRPKRFLDKELYSKRIKWGVELSDYLEVDLYGKGWDKIFSRASLWFIFLKNYLKIQKIYRGPCGSKLKLMSTYDYVLCFENLEMKGYITEKIFDCFYSGAIPIYKGGPDIENYIPKECYIDLRDFESAEKLATYLLNLSIDKKQNFREAAKSFLAGEGQKYYEFINSLK